MGRWVDEANPAYRAEVMDRVRRSNPNDSPTQMNDTSNLTPDLFPFTIRLQNFRTRATRGLKTETVPVAESLGRVSAVNVEAALPFPREAIARTAGYAVRAADVVDASAEQPVSLHPCTRMGSPRVTGYGPGSDPDSQPLPEKSFMFTNRGFPLQRGADTVIPSGSPGIIQEGTFSTQHLIVDRPFGIQNVDVRASAIKPGAIVCRKNRRIDAFAVSMMTVAGIQTIKCFQKPRIAVVVCALGLQNPDALPAPGRSPDFKGHFIRNLVATWGLGSPDVRYIHLEPGSDGDLLPNSITQLLNQNDVAISCGDDYDWQAATTGLDRLRGFQRDTVIHGCTPGGRSIIYKSKLRSGRFGSMVTPDERNDYSIVNDQDVPIHPNNPVHYYDQGVLIHIAGPIVDILSAMYLVVRPLLDDVEGVGRLGPVWSFGLMIESVQPDPSRNRIVMCRQWCSAEGINQLSIIDDPSYELSPELLGVDAIALVPPGADTLPPGSIVRWTQIS